ncbi:hypothetical protein ACWD5R_42645 [Streptomyces sp. NPDC002514]|uniref:hypothetical protein n=1 Tax=Streptomyces sp. NPDC001270 TaxID=3364554 RepID=UPI00367C189E
MSTRSKSEIDPARVRIVCDWVQYRNSFRDVLEVRPILSGGPAAGQGLQVPADLGEDEFEIGVDVRRAAGAPVGDLTAELLSPDPDGVFLKDWTPGGDGLIWQFSSLSWSALERWEKATGRGYEQALPGGESDARNRAAAVELISELFERWDRLAASAALPDELYIVELGVGNGQQARVFFDTFRELDVRHGKGY